ncbi:hypothetical protein SEPCBS57363_006427 [Sporothrix epigloea]|uniref:Phosphoglycerate mutase family domain containing protein n=1 Tax=Sporothrix epigloea TaxID=1892477 RepID=A0ABP0E6A7_9PEZI
MGKPRLIILIRHGQSEGNKNRDIHQTVPDHRVRLTSEGWQQAYDAGRRLRTLLRADDTIQFFTSPYRRTRETTEGVLQTLTSDSPEPSPFKRNNIKVYEEPRLREQDFGNFQPCSAEMERMWQERADYGHFFYRIPNGESAADAYDRVSGFNESMWRQFGDDDFPSVCILGTYWPPWQIKASMANLCLVTHGLMSRVFLMKWYHFSVEYFEDLRNVNHCEFLIMRKQDDSGKYKLESKLRTWSELRRERAALLKQKEEENAGAKDSRKGDKDSAKLERAAAGLTPSPSTTHVPQRRWGGCPNGCNHDKNFRIRPGLADLIKCDGTNVYNKNDANSPRTSRSSLPLHGHGSHSKMSTPSSPTPPQPRRLPVVRRFQVAGYSDDDDGGDGVEIIAEDDNKSSSTAASSANSKIGSKSIKDSSGISSGSGNNINSGSKAETNSQVNTERDPPSPHTDNSSAREKVSSEPGVASASVMPDGQQRTLSPDKVSPIRAVPFLHAGRDFGGTYSGHTSDADSSEDDRLRHRVARLTLGINGATELSAQFYQTNHAHAPGHAHVHTHTHSCSSDRLVYGTLDVVASSDASSTSGVEAKHKHASASSRLEKPDGSPSLTSPNQSNIRKKRTKTMANRLGDAPHCSDCEHEHDHGSTELSSDELDVDDSLLLASSVGEAGADVDDEAITTDSTTADLCQAEKDDRSILGSVY